jgi:CPA1 family monovalent cation:H+ antiporter
LGGAVIWQLVTFIINGLVFILIGLQFRTILNDIDERSTRSLVQDALFVSLAVIAIRLIWVYLACAGVRLLPQSLTGREVELDAREMTIVGWSGMRGVVALATALSIPRVTESGIFAERPLVLFLTFAVILVTLVGQGLTLPFIIAGLGVTRGDRPEREERRAREAMTKAALRRLDALSQSNLSPEMYRLFQRHYQNQLTLSRQPAAPGDESWVQNIREIRRELVAAEENALVRLRDQEVISDAVLHRLQRELDIEELHLETRVL